MIKLPLYYLYADMYNGVGMTKIVTIMGPITTRGGSGIEQRREEVEFGYQGG